MRKTIGKAAETRGFSEARLLTHWPEIVGEALAKIARPIKVSYARKGIGAKLILYVHGSHAPMVQMQIPQLIAKVNATYGFNAIQDIKLTQVDALGMSEAPQAFEHKPTKPLSEEDEKLIDQLVTGVADKDLKSALRTLGQNIAREQKNKDLT